MDNTATAFAAVPDERIPRPAFTVQKLQGEVQHRIHAFDKKTNKIVSKLVARPAGYLVKFMRGHSIRVWDEAHLKAIGAGMRMVPLIDPSTGDVKGAVPNSAALEAA